MIAISLKFPAGRYHATPWGRHVNEGAVEWPPSPWRLLRSLVAVWKRTLSEEPQERVEPILRALAAPPRFALPPASTGHTRHYMPWFKKDLDDRTLVFDAFVALAPEDQVLACWSDPDPPFNNSQRDLLSRLLANLNSLGRAESWCAARLLDDAEAAVLCDSANCSVLADGECPSHDDELIRTLCPNGVHAFANDQFFAEKAKKKSQSSTLMRVKTVEYEPDWHLAAETLWLHDQKWSDPPGSIWVSYVRSRDCFEVKPRTRPRRATARPVQVARFALDSTVLPLVTETLPVAEAARRYLMGIHGRMTQHNGAKGKSTVFSGKDEHGSPLSGHRHGYYLPTDEDGDGRLDHLTVYAADGFDSEEHKAFDLLRKLKTGRGGEERHPLRLLLLGMGTLGEYHPGPLQSSCEWVSATPYLATRYPKERGRRHDDARFWSIRTDEELTTARESGHPLRRRVFADPHGWLAEDLRAEIARLIEQRDELRGMISSDQVEISPQADEHGAFHIRSADNGRTIRPIQFKRNRRKPGDEGGRRLAGAFRLKFSLEVQGPLALGLSNHFGMGLFMPYPL